MAIFASNTVQTSTVGSGGTVKVFDTTSSSFATGATLRDVTIVNTGAATVYLGSSTVTAAHGLPLPKGNQLTYAGYSHVKGDTTGDIYAITSAGSAIVETGLATVNAVD